MTVKYLFKYVWLIILIFVYLIWTIYTFYSLFDSLRDFSFKSGFSFWFDTNGIIWIGVNIFILFYASIMYYILESR